MVADSASEFFLWDCATGATIQFVKKKDLAIDIGCGSSGRFIKVLREYDFEVEGLDISAEMLVLAKQRYPDLTFYQEDVCK